MIDYTALVRQVIADAAVCVPALAHIDARRVAVFAASRGGRGRCGNLATCYGLRGSGAMDEMDRVDEVDAVDGVDRTERAAGDGSAPTFTLWTRGRRSRRAIAVSFWFRHCWPRFIQDGQDCLYAIALRLPRMLVHDPLETIFHELHHIDARFNGRLSPARHGPVFDRDVRYLAEQWKRRGDAELVRRAGMSFEALEAEFGAVVAECAPPRLTMPRIEAAPSPEPYESAVARVHPGYALARGYEILPARLTPPGAPVSIDMKKLRLRHVTREGAAALPRALARYARQASAA